MPTTDTVNGKVKQYGYRTATVGKVFLSLPRNCVRELEVQLAAKAGVEINNHTVYEILQRGREATYIMFSDFTATFGSTVVERRW